MKYWDSSLHQRYRVTKTGAFFILLFQFDEQQMKLYRLDIKNRLNAPHKNENLRKKRVMAQVSETVSEEDRKRHLQSEYEEIVGEYDKGKDWSEKMKM